MPVEKLISGGQTGVDRAALDAAMAAGVPIGGWCPRGRRAEDGPIPKRYPLRETPSRVYAERTSWNVRDSDATLILSFGPLMGGTALTVQEAQRCGRPLWHANLRSAPDAQAVQAWLEEEEIRVLNVAGPRASEAPGVYAAARAFVAALLEKEALRR